VRVDLSAEESAFLASDAWATGCNTSGQLGVGHARSRQTLARLRARRAWGQLSLGDSHGAGVSADGGAVFCWGLNDKGQCGAGDTVSRLAPGRVEALDTVVCVATSCGSEHTAAVTLDGDVYCWGSNEYGQAGCASEAALVATPRLARLPRGDPSLRRVLAVACGAHHTLALTAGGAVLAWGAGAGGQLGTGDTRDRRSPSAVAEFSGAVIVCIAAGEAHSVAVSASGDVYAWGRAASGCLGLSEEEEARSVEDAAPVRPAPAAVVAVLVDMGISRAMAERAAAASPSVDAAVEYAMTHTDGGDTGAPAARGMQRGMQLLPRRITAAAGAEALPPIASVACGARHTAFLTPSGAAFTCGGGASGALGHGGSANELLPRRVARLSGRRVVAAAAGTAHSLFLLADGAVMVCGSGEEGALGLEDGREKAVPVLLPAWGPPARSVAAGGASSAFLCPDSEATATPPPPSTPATELEAALTAAESSLGAAGNDGALRAVSAAVDAALGSVRGAACAFMHRPVAPGGPLIDAARVEAASVRVLSLGLRAPEAITALREAATRLVEELAAGWAHQAGACEHAAAAAVAAQSVLLGQPALGGALLRRLCPLLAAPPPRVRTLLLHGWAATPGALLASRVVRPLQAFVTAELKAANATTSIAVAAIRTLALLEEANRSNTRGDALHPEEWYNAFVSEHFNVAEDFNLWVTGGAAFTFCGHAFLLSHAAKCRLLRFEAAMRMQATVKAARASAAAQLFRLPPESPRWLRFLAGEVGNPFGASEEGTPRARVGRASATASSSDQGAELPPSRCGVPSTAPDWCILRVRRRMLVRDALEEVARQDAADLFKPLRVHFIGEVGVDAGGLKKEFFLLLLDELLSPEHSLFVPVANGRLRWLAADGAPGSEEDARLQHRWRLMGTLIGLAIYNAVTLSLHLPAAFWKKLLGQPVGLAELDEFEPEVARSLRSLLAWEGPGSVEEVFGLTFCLSSERGVTPLRDGGDSVAVTEGNRTQYVELYGAHVLTRSCARAFDALRAQFLALCGGRALRLVSPAELDVLVCGHSHLDFKALEASARYSGGWGAEHPTVRNFWQVVHAQLSLEEQKLLLRFVTGSDRAPVGGLAALSILVTREGADSYRLPTSHTCFSQLCLPEYGSRGKLADRLRTAITNAAEGFGIV